MKDFVGSRPLPEFVSQESTKKYKQTLKSFREKDAFRHAAWCPVDCRALLQSDQQKAYAQFLLCLGHSVRQLNVPKYCISEKAAPGAPRKLFFDFDSPQSKAKDSKQPAFSQYQEFVLKLLDEFEAHFNLKTERRVFVRHNNALVPDSKQKFGWGVHVIYPNVIYNPDDENAFRGVEAWWSRCDIVARLKPFDLDLNATKRGTLRLPYQYKAGAGLDDRSYYALLQELQSLPLSSTNTVVHVPPLLLPSLHYLEMVQGSFLLVDQIPNPIYLECPNAPLPRNEASPGDAPPEESEKTGILREIQQNDASRFKPVYEAALHGRDFKLEDRDPVYVGKLLLEIQGHMKETFASKDLGWCPTQEDLDEAIVSVMNRHFAYVQTGNCVLFRNWDAITHSTTWDTQALGAFRASYPNLKWVTQAEKTVQRNTGGVMRPYTSRQKVTKDITKIWSEHPMCRTYHSLVFSPYPDDHPLSPGPHVLNIYTGWKWSPAELRKVYLNSSLMARHAADMFQKHLYNVLCDGDSEKFQFFTAFLAAKFRRPWFRPDVCFVFTGNEGSGKSSFFERLLIMAGPWGAKCTNIEHLVGNFNNEYKHKLLLFLDEASWVGNIHSNTQLKNFITSDTSTTEQKYRDREKAANYAALIMSSNDSVVVKQGDNARRFAFYPGKLNSYRQNAAQHSAYFREMLGGVDHDGYTGLQVWLSQFFDDRLYPDVYLDSFGRFTVNHFPQACLMEMEKQKPFSHSIVTKFWQRVLERGYSYPPAFDFVLNSKDVTEHLFENLDGQAVIFSDGRMNEDVCTEDSGLCKDLTNTMYRVRSPRWINPWLGTVDMEQVYEEFMKMKKTDLVPSKGVDSRVDFQAFCFYTEKIFAEVERVNGRKFDVLVRAELIHRSKIRQKCENDQEWSSLRNDDSVGQETSCRHHFFSLGTYPDCLRQFYVFSGVDIVGALRQDTMDARPGVYSSERGDVGREYFRFGPDEKINCPLLIKLSCQ